MKFGDIAQISDRLDKAIKNRSPTGRRAIYMIYSLGIIRFLIAFLYSVGDMPLLYFLNTRQK